MSYAGEHYSAGHHVDKVTRDVIGGGSVVAAIMGTVAIVLCILGLVGYYQVTFAAISAIMIGFAMLIEGGAVVARSTKLTTNGRGYAYGSDVNVSSVNVSGDVNARSDLDASSDVVRDTGKDLGWAIGSEMAVQSLVGVIGLFLGVLAWSGIAPVILLSVAAIIMGSGLLIGGASESMLGRLRPATSRITRSTDRLTFQIVEASAGIDLIFGLLAIVIGIITLIGYVPFSLVLVAMLILGLGVMLGSSALASRFLGAFK